MKKELFSMLLLFLVAVSVNAQVQTGGNQRENQVVLTVAQRQSVATANQIAAKAAEHYNQANSIETGTNARSAPVVILTTTRDGVDLYSQESQKLTYDQARNAFIPVRTNEQAVRVATNTFEPLENEAGKKLKKRKANSEGINADVIKDIKENRSKLKTKESEEEVLAD